MVIEREPDDGAALPSATVIRVASPPSREPLATPSPTATPSGARSSRGTPMQVRTPIPFPTGWTLIVRDSPCIGNCDTAPNAYRIFESAGLLKAEPLLGPSKTLAETEPMFEAGSFSDGVRIQVEVCSRTGNAPPSYLDCPRRDLYQSDDRGLTFRWVGQADRQGGYPPGVRISPYPVTERVAGAWDARAATFTRASDGKVFDVSRWRSAPATTLVAAFERAGRLVIVWEDGTTNEEKRQAYAMAFNGDKVMPWYIGGPFEYGADRFLAWGWFNDRQLIGALAYPRIGPSAVSVQPVLIPAVFDLDDGWVAPIQGVAQAFGTPPPGSLSLAGAFAPSR